ncbi:MAG TPA: kinase [Alphaproteobacteria bacterium]|nr:kinase [Alphaproteobacteria bacterium]
MFEPELQEKLQALAEREHLPADFMSTVERIYAPLAARIGERRKMLGRMMVTGICGPQGTGKSTLAEFLALLLEHSSLKTATISIDDLYLTRAEREKLAREVHPLLKTRGPPGTHDVAMGLRLMDELASAGPNETTLVPRFDKSIDDRAPQSRWSAISGRPDIILFEGWCVGARPQSQEALTEPINPLERKQDPQGIWRRYVNDSLAGAYRRLFSRIDLLVMLKPPSFDQVLEWRWLQEQKLGEKSPQGTHLMSREEIAVFIMHYERVTRQILSEMPVRADYVLEIAADHAVTALRTR